MKAKLFIALSALLIAPLLTQAQWVYIENWPWVYTEENNWEYAYTPGFWTCKAGTEEYTLWGEPESSLGQGIYDIWDWEAYPIWNPSVGLFYWPLLYFTDGESWFTGDVFYASGVALNLAEHLLVDHPGVLYIYNSILNDIEDPCGVWELKTAPDKVRWFFRAVNKSAHSRFFSILIELQFLGLNEGIMDLYIIEDNSREMIHIEDSFEILIPIEMPYPLNRWGP